MTSEGTESSLSRNTAMMAVGTLLSRATGFIRVFAVGYALGYGLADTYNLANTTPNIIYELVVGGVLSTTLIPVFVKQLNTDSEENAWHAISAVMTVSMLSVTALAALLIACAPFIIDIYTLNAHNTDIADRRAVATYLLRLFGPQVIFYGFISVATGLLQSRKKFAPPMFAPILNNIMLICVLMSFPAFTHDVSLQAIRHDTNALLLLGIGTTFGVAAMAAALVPYLKTAGQGRIRWVLEPKHPAVVTVLKMGGWTIGFVIANQIAFWLTTVLASRGQPGGLTAFLNAYQFFILPHGIFVVSVISAWQPDLAKHWSLGAVSGFRNLTSLGIRLIVLVAVPAAAIYAVLAQPIMTVILEHGRVTGSDAHLTAVLLVWLAVGLPGFSVFIYLTRVLQATQDARSVFWLYIVENGINVITAVPFYALWGVRGLAISLTIAYSAAALLALYVVGLRTRSIDVKVIVASGLRVCIAAAAMLCACGATAIALSHTFDIVQLLASAAVALIAFVIAARVVGVKELSTLLDRLPTRRMRPATASDGDSEEGGYK